MENYTLISAAELAYKGTVKSLKKLAKTEDVSSILEQLVLPKGKHKGTCCVCGLHTDKGLPFDEVHYPHAGIAEHPLQALNGKSFTDDAELPFTPYLEDKPNKALPPVYIDLLNELKDSTGINMIDKAGSLLVACPYCSLMGKNGLKTVKNTAKTVSLASVMKQRIGSSLVTESGTVYCIGAGGKTLKWMLMNMHRVKPPFIFSVRSNGTIFKHKIWMSKVSLSNKAFFIQTDNGNQFVRLSHVQCPTKNSTAFEVELHRLVTNDNIEALKPKHPFYE
jgi:hypothetical protein